LKNGEKMMSEQTPEREKATGEQVPKKRKGRRIDYSKDEIGDAVNYSRNNVDNVIEKILEAYDLPTDIFKKETAGKRNYFAAEYTPLLLLLIESCTENPRIKDSSKKKKITAKNIKEYNASMLSSIKNNKYIPDELKVPMNQLPCLKSANSIVKYIDILVEELQQLFHNLLTLENNDIGETIQFLCKEFDMINYCLFRNNYIEKKYISIKEERYRKANKEIYDKLNLEILCEEKRKEESLETKTPHDDNPIELFLYNTLKDNRSNFKSGIERVNKYNMSVDQGVVAIMKAIMHGVGHDYRQKLGEVLTKEHYSPQERKKLEEEYSKKVKENKNKESSDVEKERSKKVGKNGKRKSPDAKKEDIRIKADEAERIDYLKKQCHLFVWL